MITYMDRVVLSAAAPTIKQEFGFNNETWSWITASFRTGYSLFQLPGVGSETLVGPRRALTVIVIWWSIFTSMTALAYSAWSMMAVRFLFGVGEAGAFPIATRSLSRWMLPTERGYAQGITHAGSRLGAALTPTLVGAMIVAYSWRMPFYTFGYLGIIWAAVWYWYYRDTPDEHKSVNSAELELLHSSLGGPKTKVTRTVPWGAIFASRTLWVLTAMYFCYGWCQAVYIDWFPTYLTDHRGLKTLTMGFYSSVPLLGASAR
jgi:MFS family permease